MQIRPITREDFKPLLVFCEQMHRESPVYRDMRLDPDKLTRIGETVLTTPDRACGLVAVKHGDICGMFVGLLTEPYFGPGLLAADLALFVPPDMRGGAAAVALIKAFEAWARAHGADSAQLGVTTGVQQLRTQELYRKMGFEPIGIVCRKALNRGG